MIKKENMKTRFGTIVLIAGHNGKLEIKYFPYIERDISQVIHEEHTPSQAPGDFLLDIRSFRPFGGEFAVVSPRSDQDDWIIDATHKAVITRLAKWDGIVRVRLGKMISFKVGGFFVRIWNFLDEGGNTITWHISKLAEPIPSNVKRALVNAGTKLHELVKEHVQPSEPSRYDEHSINPFPLSLAFAEEPEDWSPSDVLTPLHIVTESEVNSSRQRKRITPCALRYGKQKKA